MKKIVVIYYSWSQWQYKTDRRAAEPGDRGRSGQD